MAVNFANVTDITIPEGNVTALSINGTQVWEKPSGSRELCFTAEQANSSVRCLKSSSPVDVNLEYSTDKITWLPYDVGIGGSLQIALPNVGSKVYFRGENIYFSGTYWDYVYFELSGRVGASGDVTSLLNNVGGDVELYNGRSFCRLFYYCASLTSAPSLPSTTFPTIAYREMFKGCTNLANVPKLPATDLKSNCYFTMFADCTSLIVSDTQTDEAPYAWRIPESGDATGTTTQTNMFTNCLGTRSTDSPNFATQKTFYTQNPPV